MRNSGCTDCPLHKDANTVCMWGEGSPRKSKVMIIGDSPNYQDDKAGRPFTGDAGKLLRTELMKVGMKPEDVYMTYALKCSPPQHAKPKAAEIKACRKYLDEEMAQVKPEYVITLGSLSTKAVLKHAKITEIHGQIKDYPGFKGMGAYSPSFCLYDPSKLPTLQKDLRRMADEIQGVKPVTSKTKFVWREVKPDNIDEFFADLETCKWFSFDLETSKLEWFNPFERWVSCLNMSFDNPDGGIRTWVMPLTMPYSPYRNRERQERIIKKIARRLKKRKKKGCGHNAKYDNLWLRAVYGVTFPLDFDTMLASHCIDENRAHGLDSLATYYLDAPYYDIPLNWKQGRFKPNEKCHQNVRKTYRYGAKDAYYTLMMRPLMEKELAQDKDVYRLFYRLVMRASRAIHHVEWNGLFVIMDQFNATRRDVVRQRDEALRILDKMVSKKTGGQKINWNSPQQVGKLLFKKLKLPIIEKTGTGAPSTGEATLVALKDKHPIATQLVKYREIDKFLSTYLDGWKTLMHHGKVYFSYKIHGTVTGRYSSRLHQTPRDGTIRNLVDAPPGWTFVQGDFSQAELRVAAILSGDLELMNCFRQGIDVHWRTLLYMVQSGGVGEYVQPVIDTAQKLTGRKRIDFSEAIEILGKTHHDACIEIWKGWKEGRKKAKGINFGFVYGMMERKFIETAKLKYGFEPTEQEARDYRIAYFQLYRGLKPWHEKQKKLVKLDGYVRSLSGRLRRLPGIYSSDRKLRSECERQAINSPVQGFIGDFKAMAMVELVEKLDRSRSRVVGEHHDAILFWVRTEYLEEELPKIAKIMQDPELVKEFKIDLPVPIEVELEIGPWGKGKKWTPKVS